MADNNNITFEQIKEFFEANKGTEEVNAFVAETGKTFFETDAGKDFLQPSFDRATTKGIETFKTKSLPSLIEQETQKKLKELNPEETPQDKRIRELEEKLKAQETNAFMANLQSQASKELGTKGLPVELSGMLSFDSEETMRDSVNKLEEMFKPYVESAVESRLKNNGKTPNGAENTGYDEKAMTKDKLLAMSTTEATKFYNQNPELFTSLMKS